MILLKKDAFEQKFSESIFAVWLPKAACSTNNRCVEWFVEERILRIWHKGATESVQVRDVIGDGWRERAHEELLLREWPSPWREARGKELVSIQQRKLIHEALLAAGFVREEKYPGSAEKFEETPESWAKGMYRKHLGAHNTLFVGAYAYEKYGLNIYAGVKGAARSTEIADARAENPKDAYNRLLTTSFGHVSMASILGLSPLP